MHIIRKQFKFEMAHQLKTSYTVGCQNLHGHSYTVEVFLTRPHLDITGMVVDFGKISDLFKNYINDYWDHSLVIPDTFDIEYLTTLKRYNKNVRIVNYNPTAENMAQQMYMFFNEALESEYHISKNERFVCKVRVHETVTGWAEYSE